MSSSSRMGVTGEWQRGPVIGRGASATVSIAADWSTGQVFAVKSVELARASVLKREQRVLSAVGSSPYVVACLGSAASVADGSRSFDLFLEYAPGGSLADEIRRRGCRCDEEEEEAWIRARAADVLRGLAHVHAAGVAHCDVKGRNVLLRADGRAVLADFGCARWIAAEGDDDDGGNAAAIRGTPAFMAPEAARGETQGLAADVWAVGCTVIEMATGGAAPWGPKQRFADPVAALHHVARSGEVPEPPAWLSDEGKDFLSRCLVRDPAKRWTPEQLLRHPFVASAAAVDPPAAAAKGAPPVGRQRVSPKSVLDQAFWEEPDSSSATDDADTTLAAAEMLSPADRVRALAGVAPDWTWTSGGSGEEDGHWITIFTADSAGPPESDASSSSSNSDADNSSSSSSPREQFDAEEAGGTVTPIAGAPSSSEEETEEPRIGGGGEQQQHVGADASRGGREGDGDDGASSSSPSSRIDSSNNRSECSLSGGTNSAGASTSNSSENRVVNSRTLPNWLVNVSPPRSELAAVFFFSSSFSLFRRCCCAFFFFSSPPPTFPGRVLSSRARREP